MSAQDTVVKGARTLYEDFIKKGMKGQDINGFNKAINIIGNNVFGVPEAAGRILNGENFGQAIKSTFGKAERDAAGNIVSRSAENGWDVGKIAGSYLGVATAGRVLTGGGVYRDANGDTNIIGVPFV